MDNSKSLTAGEKEAIVREAGEGLLEICIDRNHITISVSRFEELLKTEMEHGLIRRIYDTSFSYQLKDMLSLLFGPSKKQEDNQV